MQTCSIYQVSIVIHSFKALYFYHYQLSSSFYCKCTNVPLQKVTTKISFIFSSISSR
uniref:Uncharacterized protein n=1 Tax=Amphimedon queenslandica TaxID=400682 RepID=A0A1X7VTF0_AMPQE